MKSYKKQSKIKKSNEYFQIQGVQLTVDISIKATFLRHPVDKRMEMKAHLTLRLLLMCWDWVRLARAGEEYPLLRPTENGPNDTARAVSTWAVVCLLVLSLGWEHCILWHRDMLDSGQHWHCMHLSLDKECDHSSDLKQSIHSTLCLSLSVFN